CSDRPLSLVTVTGSLSGAAALCADAEGMTAIAEAAMPAATAASAPNHFVRTRMSTPCVQGCQPVWVDCARAVAVITERRGESARATHDTVHFRAPFASVRSLLSRIRSTKRGA